MPSAEHETLVLPSISRLSWLNFTTDGATEQIMDYWKLLHEPSYPSVGWSVGWFVCHDFLKGQEVTLPCSYRNSSLSSLTPTDPLYFFLSVTSVRGMVCI